MVKTRQILQLLVLLGAALLLLALAVRAATSETLTLRASPAGLELKAEGARP
jgi:hypothetical protein